MTDWPLTDVHRKRLEDHAGVWSHSAERELANAVRSQAKAALLRRIAAKDSLSDEAMRLLSEALSDFASMTGYRAPTAFDKLRAMFPEPAQ